MFPTASEGSFCGQIFLDPKMKIFVQGFEVEAGEILPSLEEKETFGIDIFNFLGQDEITESVHDGRITSSKEHGPSPPYNIAVHVSSGTVHGTMLCLFSMRKFWSIFGRGANMSERMADLGCTCLL